MQRVFFGLSLVLLSLAVGCNSAKPPAAPEEMPEPVAAGPGEVAPAKENPSEDSSPTPRPPAEPTVVDGKLAGTIIRPEWLLPEFKHAIIVRPEEIVEAPEIADDQRFDELLAPFKDNVLAAVHGTVLTGEMTTDAEGNEYRPQAEITEFVSPEVMRADLQRYIELFDHQKSEINGVEVYKPAEDSVFQYKGLVVINDRTLMNVTLPQLENMVAGKGSIKESPLREFFGSVDAGLVVEFYYTDPAADQELFENAISNSPAAAFQEPIQAAMSDVANIRIKIDVAPKILFTVTGTMKDQSAATDAAEQLTGLKALGLNFWNEAKAELPNQAPEELQAVIDESIMNYADRVVNSVSVKQDGKQLTVAITGLGTLAEVKEIFADKGFALMEQQMSGPVGGQLQIANNMKQTLLAMHNYSSVYDNKFPKNLKDGETELLSWRVALLPYLEEGPRAEQFKQDEPWDSEHNNELVNEMPTAYGNGGDDSAGQAHIVAVAGPGTAFDSAEKLFDIKDGLSNTALLVLVSSENRIPWTKPQDYKYDPEEPAKGLAAINGKYLFGMGDGSVRSIPVDQATPEFLKAIFTADGGEVVNWPE